MVTVPKSDFEGLRDEVRSLAAKLKEMKNTMSKNNKPSESSLPLGPGYNSGQQNNPRPQCWKCSQYGNIARNCRVRTEHMRKNINFRQSTGRGHS